MVAAASEAAEQVIDESLDAPTHLVSSINDAITLQPATTSEGKLIFLVGGFILRHFWH